MDGNIVSLGLKSFGKRNLGLAAQVNIEHFVTIVTIKMAMLVHIRAKPCRPAFQGYLPYEATFYEGGQAIIDRCHGNLR